MLLNLFYKSSQEKDSPKKSQKSHATAYLKLPIKSVHRKKDKEADDSGAHRSPGRQPGENECVVIPKVESPDESQSLIKVIKSEPLEEGEIEEIPQVRTESEKVQIMIIVFAPELTYGDMVEFIPHDSILYLTIFVYIEILRSSHL
ncbi:unnamed protein product [Nippostrongylus brasiliensis]|uniref:Band_3_cyto domain-containing protein n=1 Tax=Nippostrongylus brasiliensis TaxID=27835 RepID=A0A0N4XMU3_NIPBR|nr:unnamed protein product [Nippostrongylus brasiliensis]